MSNNKLPTNAIKIPIILLEEVCVLKNIAPVTITKTGVRQFKVPASELSIPSSAKQNKKAGTRLPIVPDIKTMKSLLEGIWRINFIVVGNSINPAETILRAAIW